MKKGILFLLILLFGGTLYARETVVLIHGFLLTSHHMVPIGRELPQKCFRDCYFEFDSRKDTYCGHAWKLKERLKCLASENPGQPIHFVTHSIGALILKVALNYSDCPEEAKIGRAVLLTPPAHGSWLARKFANFLPVRIAAGKKLGWELTHYTPEQVDAFGEFPESMCILVIAGCRGLLPLFPCPNDGLLTVEETRLNTPHFHTVIKETHGGIITSSKAMDLTKCFLYYGEI